MWPAEARDYTRSKPQPILSIVIPYYNNRRTLEKAIGVWTSYSDRALQAIEILLVDDCSPPVSAAIRILRRFKTLLRTVNLRVFRVKVDISWNQPACNNIGFFHSTAPWVFRTDIDHWLSNSTLTELLFGGHLCNDKPGAYLLSRLSFRDAKPLTPNPNIYVIHQSLLKSVKGYDERYSGHYGDDIAFRLRAGKFFTFESFPEDIYAEVDVKGGTRGVDRNTTFARELTRRFSAEHWEGEIKFLSYPYEECFL